MARIVKKNYILRHIILIIITILVLFPLVWVVATSIRRDNAAFSPKLFSSRVTLRNYQELLFPQQNVPEVIKDFSDLSSYIGDYSDYTYEKALKKSDELSSDLRKYVTDSANAFIDIEKIYTDIFDNFNKNYINELISDVNVIRTKDSDIIAQDYTKINSFFEQNGIKTDTGNLEKLISDFLSKRSEIFSELKNYEQSFPEYYSETRDVLFSFPLKTTVWKIRVYNKWKREEPNADVLGQKVLEMGDLSKEIENEMNSLDEFISQGISEKYAQFLDNKSTVENVIETVNNKITETNKTKEALNKNLSDLNNKFSAISDIYIPQKERVISAYNIIKKLSNEDNQIFKLDPDDENIYQILSVLSKELKPAYDNIQSIDIFINNGLADTLKIYSETFEYMYDNFYAIIKNKEKDEFASSYQALDSVILKLEITANDINLLSEQYVDVYEKIAKADKDTESLEESLKNAQSELQNMVSENSDYENIQESENFSKLVFVKSFTENPINNVDEAYYYSLFMSSKYYSGFSPELKRYFLMEWYYDLVESKAKYDSGRQKMETLMGNLINELDKYEANKDDLLKLNLGTNVAAITIIENMEDLYDKNYNSAKADLARASRIVSDMSDNTKYGSLKRDLRKIDKDLYNFDENWTKKIRKPFVRWILNSLIIAIVSSVITVFITSIAAYPFSRMRFRGRKQGLLFLMLIQMFPAIMYMVAMYGLLKFIGTYVPFIGLDKLGGIIFIYLGGIAYNMWLFKGYYDTIPDTLEEAAMIDGATRFQTFWMIVFPLSLPIIAVVIILSFMSNFNEFVLARIILQSEQNFTYAVGLQQFSNANGPFETEWGLFTAAALIGAVPMVILFLSMQDWIVGGMTQGSVKG